MIPKHIKRDAMRLPKREAPSRDITSGILSVVNSRMVMSSSSITLGNLG
eukprot:CAMPEP_0115030634 /NCGR_PEP_ID=MMETSP0216-20121206/37939_1 /TAXON_ID=223996 /ORGANISM="Protocruzia adherens, Strain Boccale" /LENGTH=48 /DNA_ID= /DNA_START= /DNA_END= /DNA_ORIENTATION=